MVSNLAPHSDRRELGRIFGVVFALASLLCWASGSKAQDLIYTHQKISQWEGGLAEPAENVLPDDSKFGYALAKLGDVDGADWCGVEGELGGRWVGGELGDGVHDRPDLVDAGARVLETGCGPCVGMGQAPPTGSVSVRSFDRNSRMCSSWV